MVQFMLWRDGSGCCAEEGLGTPGVDAGGQPGGLSVTGGGGAGGLGPLSVVVAGSSWISGMFGSQSQWGLLMGSLWGAEEIAEPGMPPEFLA